MCNGPDLAKWQLVCLKRLIDDSHLPSLLIINKSIAPSSSLIKKIRRYPYRRALFRIMVRFFHHPGCLQRRPAGDLLSGVPEIYCQVDKKGSSDYFLHNDIEHIRSFNLDFILRFGFNIIRGDILDAAKYGTWSFHHGDEQKFRGGPPGWWEIYTRNSVTGAVLQRLTSKLDAGVILKKGYFKTIKHSWSASIDQLFMETTHWPAQVADEMANGIKTPDDFHESNTSAPVFKAPQNFKMIFFLCKLLRNKFLFHYESLFKAEKWNIGVAEVTMTDLLDTEKQLSPFWIKEEGSHLYRADPFGYYAGGKLNILFESYDYRQGKGKIAQLGFLPGDLTKIECTDVFQKDHHLAYPYLFKEDEEWYCVPESAAGRKIELYRLDRATGRFDFVKCLLDNIDAVDVSMVKYHHLWWMFFTRRFLSDTHLYIYYSENLSGPYTSHFLNPVKSDIHSSRPAGTMFLEGGQLYRPAQDCSLTYGGSVRLQRVEKLSAYEFSEVTVKVFKPDEKGRYNKGLHTLALAGKYAIIDGKRYIFDRFYFCRTLKRKFFRLTGKDKTITG